MCGSHNDYRLKRKQEDTEVEEVGNKNAVESVLLRLDLNQQREGGFAVDQVFESKDVVGCREGIQNQDRRSRWANSTWTGRQQPSGLGRPRGTEAC